jgi:hypothetical protein
MGHYSMYQRRGMFSFVPQPVAIGSVLGPTAGEDALDDTNAAIAALWTPSATHRLVTVWLMVRRVGLPAGTVRAALWGDNAGVPGALLSAAVPLTAAGLPTGLTFVQWPGFSWPLVSGTPYWIGAQYQDGTASDYVSLQLVTNASSALVLQGHTGTWGPVVTGLGVEMLLSGL